MFKVPETYKNKNSKQEYQTESVNQTEIWIMNLENAIAAAGKTPKSSRKMSVSVNKANKGRFPSCK